MEKIEKLKKIFKKEKIDGYIVPKNDEFFCEYIPDHNDRLNFISKFNGSYGFALILKNKNFLFVDGRYTLQASKQCGQNFKIVTIPNKMPSDILKGEKLSIGFDPKLFTKKSLSILFGKSKCNYKPIVNNLVDKIWKRKIKEKNNKFFILPKSSVSEKFKSKINKISFYLKRKKSDYLFITASENNAWLLNIRGRDTKYTPIPFSYILIDKNKNIKFFCNLKKISSNLKKSFSKNKIFGYQRLCSNTLKNRKEKIYN